MNFFENEYTLPVILGGGKEAVSVANTLRGNTDLKIHIFAQKLGFIDKLIYKYHKLTSKDEDILLLTLNDFADSLNELYTPVLIYCDSEGLDFVEKNFALLEQRYVIISAQTTKNFFAKGDAFYDETQ